MPTPSFTVVLPVRNGGEHLKLCIRSILAQTAQDFALEVLENGSSDGTREWLESLRDRRIRIWPARVPLAIEHNWARIRDLPKRDYLTIVGHDDVLDPDFLETIARLIAKVPDAGLYHTHFRLVDASGTLIRSCQPMPELESASEFLACRLAGIRDSYGTGYVMASRRYDDVGGIPPFPQLLFADDALILKLMMASGKATSPKEAFSYRLHSASMSWRPAVEPAMAAFDLYLAFILDTAARDSTLASVLQRYLPTYVVRYCWTWYDLLIREACEAGRRVPQSAYDRVDALARRFADKGPSLDRNTKIESLKWVNRLPARKWAYRVWTAPPHGFLARLQLTTLEWLYRLSRLPESARRRMSRGTTLGCA